MLQPPSYHQSVKEASRVQLWTNAIHRLTTDRAETRIIPENYMRNLWEHSKTKVLRPYTNIQDLDDGVCDQWCAFADSSYGKREASDLKIAYLSGPEPENDLAVLLSLGVQVWNVWTFEQDSNMYESALKKAHALYPALKIYPGKIEDFVATSHIRFDIVYLDFAGPLFSASSKPFRSLHSALEKHALSPLSILIVNSAEPEITDDSVNLLASYFQHQQWVEGTVYGEKTEDGDLVEHYIDGPDSYCYEPLQMRDFVRQNFGAAYSAFATQYPALYANYVQPAFSVVTNRVARKRFFNPDENALDAEINRFSGIDAINSNILGRRESSESGSGNFEVQLGSDLMLSPCRYPLEHFVLGLSDLGGKDARSLLGFYNEKESGFTRSRAVESFDVLRSIMEGYWKVLSPEMLSAIREVYRALPDRQGGLFCDVPMVHLWAEAALYQLGFPYHVNVQHHWRATYVAKVRRMYLDSFVLDQCRAFYDWMPMIELYGRDLSSINRQMISRICMDAICKSRGDMIPQLYSGANVICLYTEDWAKKAELRPREDLGGSITSD